jgi:hypothetical protein
MLLPVPGGPAQGPPRGGSIPIWLVEMMLDQEDSNRYELPAFLHIRPVLAVTATFRHEFDRRVAFGGKCPADVNVGRIGAIHWYYDLRSSRSECAENARNSWINRDTIYVIASIISLSCPITKGSLWSDEFLPWHG